MINLIEKVMGAARKYTVVDYGFFKFLMISFGVLIGTYFAQTILNFIWLIWIVFFVSAMWMIYKIYIYTLE